MQYGSARHLMSDCPIFGLEISPEKTKTIEFGPFAEAKAKRRGGKAATFDFLGFTHYCSRSRNGRRFRMKRVTSRKKFTAKIRMFRDWLKANRTLPTDELMEKVASKLRGTLCLLRGDGQLKRHQSFCLRGSMSLVQVAEQTGKTRVYELGKA